MLEQGARAFNLAGAQAWGSYALYGPTTPPYPSVVDACVDMLKTFLVHPVIWLPLNRMEGPH